MSTTTFTEKFKAVNQSLVEEAVNALKEKVAKSAKYDKDYDEDIILLPNHEDYRFYTKHSNYWHITAVSEELIITDGGDRYSTTDDLDPQELFALTDYVLTLP